MSTPKKIKRASRIVPNYDPSDMMFVGALVDPDFCIAFAEVVTDFVFLEERLSTVLASLMNAPDPIVANYILHSLNSPSARVTVMRKLLQDAPINEDKSAAYDKILNDFEGISAQRNRYVHGRWWTSATGEVLLDNTLDPSEPFQDVKIVELQEIRDLGTRITELQAFIGEEVDIIFQHGNFGEFDDQDDQG